jgi:hypothetical protein
MFIAKILTDYINSVLPDDQLVPNIPWDADQDYLKVGFQTDDLRTGERVYRGVLLGFVRRGTRPEDGGGDREGSGKGERSDVWLQVTPDYAAHRFHQNKTDPRLNSIEHDSMEQDERFRNRSTQRVEMAFVEKHAEQHEEWVANRVRGAVASAFSDAFHLERNPVSQETPLFDIAQLKVNEQFLAPEHTVERPKLMEVFGSSFQVSERFGQSRDETEKHFEGQAVVEVIPEAAHPSRQEPTAEERRATEKAQKEFLESERTRLVQRNNR